MSNQLSDNLLGIPNSCNINGLRVYIESYKIDYVNYFIFFLYFLFGWIGQVVACLAFFMPNGRPGHSTG